MPSKRYAPGSRWSTQPCVQHLLQGAGEVFLFRISGPEITPRFKGKSFFLAPSCRSKRVWSCRPTCFLCMLYINNLCNLWSCVGFSFAFSEESLVSFRCFRNIYRTCPGKWSVRRAKEQQCFHKLSLLCLCVCFGHTRIFFSGSLFEASWSPKMNLKNRTWIWIYLDSPVACW